MEKQYNYVLTVSEYFKPYGAGQLVSRFSKSFVIPEECFEAFIKQIDELQAQGFKFTECDNVHYIFMKDGNSNYYDLSLTKQG